MLDGARRSGDRVIEMETLNALGILQLRTDLSAAAAFHEAALEIAQELEDKAAQTIALDRLSVISSHLLELDRGLELGERSLGLARDTGDPSAVGRAMDSIKLAALQLGDLWRLRELTDELERLWRERSDLWYLQWTLLESAFVPIGAARWDEASERLAEAVAINRRVRDPWGRGADSRCAVLAAPQPWRLRGSTVCWSPRFGARRQGRLGGLDGADARVSAARALRPGPSCRGPRARPRGG